MPLAAAVALLLAAGPAASGATDPADALRAADVAFARAVAEGDRAAFADLIDPEAVFGGSARLREGRAAIVESWSVFLREGGPRLTWAPDRAASSASGELGYTIGHSRVEHAGPDGKPTATEGRYLTVWRRGPDGRYRALFDLSYDPDAARAVEGASRWVAGRASSAAGDLSAEMGTWSRAHGGGGPASGAYLTVSRRSTHGTPLPDAATATTFRGAPAAPPAPAAGGGAR